MPRTMPPRARSEATNPCRLQAARLTFGPAGRASWPRLVGDGAGAVHRAFAEKRAVLGIERHLEAVIDNAAAHLPALGIIRLAQRGGRIGEQERRLDVVAVGNLVRHRGPVFAQ